jgi:glycosyltransferase involved in cell wall biosynthesis
MGRKPRVSIVIPAYNHEKYVAQTIRSIQDQTFTDWELVIVEDGSPDNTLAVVQECARGDDRIRVHHQQNAGITATRNKAVSLTTPGTEFMSFIDSDDTWSPRMLELLINAADAHPYALGAYGMATYVDSDGRPIRLNEFEDLCRDRVVLRDGKLTRIPDDEGTSFEVMAYQNVMPASAVLARRAALDAIGPIDPETSPVEDYDLWLRMCAGGYFVFVPEVVLYYRWHGKNTSGDNPRMRGAMETVRRKILSSPLLSEQQRAYALETWRYNERVAGRAHMEWARGGLREGKVVPAAKQLRQALKHYLRSFQRP